MFLITPHSLNANFIFIHTQKNYEIILIQLVYPHTSIADNIYFTTDWADEWMSECEWGVTFILAALHFFFVFFLLS